MRLTHVSITVYYLMDFNNDYPGHDTKPGVISAIADLLQYGVIVTNPVGSPRKYSPTTRAEKWFQLIENMPLPRIERPATLENNAVLNSDGVYSLAVRETGVLTEADLLAALEKIRLAQGQV